MSLFTKEDVNKLLENLDDSGSGYNTEKSERFTPRHDKNTGKELTYNIRPLPLSSKNPGVFLKLPGSDKTGIRTHFFNAEGWVRGVCPRAATKKEDDCIMCNVFFGVWSSPEVKNDGALMNTVKRLGPDYRNYMNIYNRDAEVFQVWSIPYGAFHKVKDEIDRGVSRRVFVMDPEDGRDLELTVGPVAGGDNSMVKTVSMDVENSPLGIDNWEDQMLDLEAFARGREFTNNDLAEFMPIVLGDHYEKIMEIHKKYNEEETEEEELGESV